jgi:transposase-like protein
VLTRIVKGAKNGTGVNWRKIKAEYIAGGISQRKLAEKYGINPNLLMRHAHKEKWNDKRKAAENKALERVEQKTAEIVADNATLLERIKTGLLQKVAVMVENFPDVGAGEMRRREADGTELIYRMRDIAAIYETLQDKLPKGQAADIEDLSPLVELLKDE